MLVILQSSMLRKILLVAATRRQQMRRLESSIVVLMLRWLLLLVLVLWRIAMMRNIARRVLSMMHGSLSQIAILNAVDIANRLRVIGDGRGRASSSISGLTAARSPRCVAIRPERVLLRSDHANVVVAALGLSKGPNVGITTPTAFPRVPLRDNT